MSFFEIPQLILAIAAAASAIVKLLLDNRERKKAEEQVNEAEKQAFQSVPASIVERTKELAESQVNLEEKARNIAQLIETSRTALQSGSLFNLYSKQIEKYQTQTQTQARAGWSFIFAIIAMGSGLALVVWGGSQILLQTGWEHVAAGTAISTIGAAVSAFITKTFLDVHRLSLIQLNHYFRQPVLNAHILTAQRLADQLPDGPVRQKAYEEIISKICQLITAQPVELTDIYGRPIETRPVSSSRAPRKPKKKVTDATDQPT